MFTSTPATTPGPSLRKLARCALPALCLLLTACSESDDSDGDGQLSVSITDAPIYDAQKVEIDFGGIEIKPADGPARSFVFCKDPVNPVFNPPIVEEDECSATDPVLVTIDLLEQTGGASYLLLDRIDLEAGRINWLRLAVADPAGRLVLSTGTYDLTVPSGNQTGLKLNRGFTIPEDGQTHVYIDFDVRKSIVQAGANYRLKPTLRLVEEFGAIAGEVSALLLQPTCLGPTVYVFEGAAATPDDIERDKDDPVSSAMVVTDATSTTGYSYRADFLEPGDYTVAFVCADGVSPDGGLTFTQPADDPDSDDAVNFTLAVPSSSATVIDGDTQTIDF